MHSKQLIWLNCLVTVGVVTSTSIVARANESDTSGIQTYSAPSVTVNSPTEFGSFSGSGSGTGSGLDLGSFSESGSGSGFRRNVDGSEPREVTINEIAEALQNGLEQSLDNLAAAESSAKLAESEPRRIARRSTDGTDQTKACINPAYEAREILKQQLAETEKFIEQVDKIEPQKNIW